MLVFTTEEIWKMLPADKQATGSVHQAEFAEPDSLVSAISKEAAEQWSRLAQVRSAVLVALEQARAGKRSIQAILSHLFERVGEEPARSPELARALLSSFLASDRIRQSLDRNMAEGRQMAAEIIELGQQRGEINPKLKKDQVALHFQQTFLGTLLLWSLRGESKLQKATEASFQHFWRAIAVPD